MKQSHIYISGFVQGVGFRYFVRKNAEKLGVRGWVRNIADNRVEAIFQGDKALIEKLIELCNTGPMLSEVKEVDVIWEEGKDEYIKFEIKTK